MHLKIRIDIKTRILYSDSSTTLKTDFFSCRYPAKNYPKYFVFSSLFKKFLLQRNLTSWCPAVILIIETLLCFPSFSENLRFCYAKKEAGKAQFLQLYECQTEMLLEPSLFAAHSTPPRKKG